MSYTINEAAKEVGVGRSYLSEIIRKGFIVFDWVPPIIERGTWKLTDEDVEKMRTFIMLTKAGFNRKAAGDIVNRAQCPHGVGLYLYVATDGVMTIMGI